MQQRNFGKLNWKVSEVGYGMWGMAGWTESDDKETAIALDKSVELGCNFFDTAFAYGAGKSETILNALVKRHPEKKLYVATKIPPKNLKWPPIKGSNMIDVFPIEHIVEYTEKSLKNLGVETIDLQQFHVWEDDWAKADNWKSAIEKLKREGKVQAFGISVNRWEPTNCMKAMETGLIDAIQVIYNIFDQSPEDELFPYCQKNNIAIIARVPFDEGSLTGTLTKESKWDTGDWRNIYFCKDNLEPTIDRVEDLMKIIPAGMTLPEMALKFIQHHPAVSTMIPGMRKIRNVENNMKVGNDGSIGLSQETLALLRKHRWDRVPSSWSC
ncbi:MAG: aldo/keto reductase [Bacteroidetes bacterium]|nr:aldo/keto reductase [Bacteroidota bacterium]